MTRIFFLTLLSLFLLAHTLPLSMHQVVASEETSEPEASPEASTPPVGSGGVVGDPEEEASESPESTSEAVCVDEQYLISKGHSLSNMVHRQATLANTYCPVEGTLPCGTEHHKIRLADGSSTSYRQLCEQVECSRKVMKVNSVFSHIWQDEAHHDGIKLTMFDVRHPEKVQTAVHTMLKAVRRVIA